MIDLSDEELLYYARQILLEDWDEQSQLNLKNSKVLMVGMGGLGCPVATILARAGVGTLHVLDFDVIEISNLQRQSLFTLADLGQSKAKIACQSLQAQNPHIHVSYEDIKITKQNAWALLEAFGADLVIDGTDNFAVRDLLNQTCRHLDMALLSNSAIGELGQIALFTEQTGCYRCVFDYESADEQTCATSGVLGSTVQIVGAISSQVALQFLGKKHNPIAGELLLWHGKTLQLKKLRFDKNPSCATCHC